MEEKLPRLPRYNLWAIFQLRRRLAEQAEFCCADLLLDDDQFSHLLTRLLDVLPAEVAEQVVYESLQHLRGQRLSAPLIQELSWLLAGNLDRLKRFEVVAPWRSQVLPEWMPLQLIDQYPLRDRKGRFSGCFSFRVLAGSAAGLVVTKVWTRKFCGYLSKFMGFATFRQMRGYAPGRGIYPFADMREMVGLRLYGYFLPRYSSLAAPGFDTIRVPNSLLEYNRRLLKDRERLEAKCPAGYTHPCYQCAVGTDRCLLAVHSRTFVRKGCPGCEKLALFDPARKVDLCITCQYKLDNTVKG